jgi:hypothetical protein
VESLEDAGETRSDAKIYSVYLTGRDMDTTGVDCDDNN